MPPPLPTPSPRPGAQPPTPSGTQLDPSPRNNNHPCGGAAGAATEHPVEVIGRVRNLTASALEVPSGGSGTTMRVRGDAGGCRDFRAGGSPVTGVADLQSPRLPCLLAPSVLGLTQRSWWEAMDASADTPKSSVRRVHGLEPPSATWLSMHQPAPTVDCFKRGTYGDESGEITWMFGMG